MTTFSEDILDPLRTEIVRPPLGPALDPSQFPEPKADSDPQTIAI